MPWWKVYVVTSMAKSQDRMAFRYANQIHGIILTSRQAVYDCLATFNIFVSLFLLDVKKSTGQVRLRANQFRR